jgi:hypothetical protein
MVPSAQREGLNSSASRPYRLGVVHGVGGDGETGAGRKDVAADDRAATRSSDGGVFDGGGDKAVEADAGCAVDAESLVYDGAETMG